MKLDLSLTDVTGEKEIVYPRLELGKAYYVMGVTYARRHTGSVIQNYTASMQYLEKACKLLPDKSPDWLLANAMLAKSHAGVDAPEAANAGQDYGEITDNVDTAIKRLELSLESVDLNDQKKEFGELHWQVGYLYHLKLRQVKGVTGKGKGAIDNSNHDAANKLVETCIDHLSKVRDLCGDDSRPFPVQFCDWRRGIYSNSSLLTSPGTGCNRANDCASTR